ncbi:MAG: hypothetical protein Q4A01_01520 [Coriobacteriales bacterium]|nr:hypothetical protein [Coriobacteriales bacterium]
MAFGKRFATIIVAGTMVLGTLAGCGATTANNGDANVSEEKAAAPASAQEVFDAYQANENSKNYHMDLDMSMNVKAAEMEIPISIKMGSDVVVENSHGDMTMNMAGQDVKAEMYTTKQGDKYIVYTGTDLGGEKTWIKQSTTTNMSDSVADIKGLEKAEFEVTDTGYKITVPGEQISELLSSASGGQDLFASMGEEAAASMKKSLADSKIVYNFDKECLLRDMTFDCNIEYTAGSGDSAQTATMELKFNAVMDNYGKIEPKSVEVPEDVKTNAIDADEATATTEETTTTTTETETTADAA